MTWRATILDLRGQGFDVLDWLSAIDDGGEGDGGVRVTACLVSSAEPAAFRLVSAAAPVASIADVFPSAAWHERETAEMFGIRFEGSADSRPLLLAEGAQPPLRKDRPLAHRLQAWPGAVDPAKPARIQHPPGTPWQ